MKAEIDPRHTHNKQRVSKGGFGLAFTLKQQTSKLKKRGMGPYLIHDLSMSGAVHLATLDGVPWQIGLVVVG